MKKLGWRIVPVIFFLILSVFFYRGLSLDPHHLPSVQIGKRLPEFDLQQLADEQLHFNSKQLPSRPYLLNVWASWCAACIDEQTFMMQLAREGVPIYGLNYKDDAKSAGLWLKQWGNPYQLIGQDKEGRVAIDLGVYGAPETFLIDKNGLIRYRHVGIMDQEIWNKTIAPLYKQLDS